MVSKVDADELVLRIDVLARERDGRVLPEIYVGLGLKRAKSVVLVRGPREEVRRSKLDCRFKQCRRW